MGRPARQGQVRIRCAQLSPQIGSLAENFARIEHEIVQAVHDGIDLLVLPELATSGYLMTPDEARSSAILAGGSEIKRWSELLSESGTTAVIGFCEDGGDVLYNSAVALVAGADPVVYRKLHLWNSEKRLFASGAERPPIVQTPFGELGVIICYDLEFPELPRSLALSGAEIIAVPTNWPVRQKPAAEHPQEVIHAMAAAQASSIVIAYCDRTGDERGVSWTGGTTVVDVDGWPVSHVDANGHLNAEVSLPSERRQISEHNHLFGDRRPEFYLGLG